MKLKPLSLGLALGVLCMLYMLIVTYYPGVTEALFGVAKGESLKALMEDLYPYYKDGKWYVPLIGIVCGFVDGFVFGVLTAGLYNLPFYKKGRK